MIERAPLAAPRQWGDTRAVGHAFTGAVTAPHTVPHQCLTRYASSELARQPACAEVPAPREAAHLAAREFVDEPARREPQERVGDRALPGCREVAGGWPERGADQGACGVRDLLGGDGALQWHARGGRALVDLRADVAGVD